MRSLKKIVGELFVAGLCGLTIGGAFGYSIEKAKEARYEEQRMKNPVVINRKYEISRGTISGGAMIGGALCAALHLYNQRKKYMREREEERNDLDDE